MPDSKFYVTTPIYYVNDRPHIGHAYTTILADVLARYHRLRGVPTMFLTGTDEHGQKVQQAAERGGISPQEQADRTVVRFQELWRKLEITHDDFIRTTEPRHVAAVQAILQDLYARGEIYRAEYDGWYCVPCERFFTERDVPAGRCPNPDCGRPVERIREANYFFRMGRYQQWLIAYIQEHPAFIQPDFRRNETLGFLRKPLNDLCISRPKSRLAWGIELPFDPAYVTYVWFDALVNYISAIGYHSDPARFQQWWPASCHLIGKDILTTHTVYWPTMLKAMGLPMPETIFAHGWWLVGETKMGKSLGNVVNPMDMVDRYGVDAFRYFLMAEMALGQDASFTEEAFVRRYNADLANDLGNLLQRVLKMLADGCAGCIPEPGTPGPEEAQLQGTALSTAAAVEQAFANMRPDLGINAVLDLVRETNRYLELRQPWTLLKRGDRRTLHTVLYHAGEVLRIAAGLFHPVMPGKMQTLRRALGLPEGAPDMGGLKTWGRLRPGARVEPVPPLFPRIAAGNNPPDGEKQAMTSPTITYADFEKIQLRTARVLAAERVAGADRLLKLQIDLGNERRQIVAGIAQHYEAAALVGRTIVVVSNLQPARIRGVESHGMLLAASSDGVLKLVTVDGEIPPGSAVK